MITIMLPTKIQRVDGACSPSSATTSVVLLLLTDATLDNIGWVNENPDSCTSQASYCVYNIN